MSARIGARTASSYSARWASNQGFALWRLSSRKNLSVAGVNGMPSGGTARSGAVPTPEFGAGFVGRLREGEQRLVGVGGAAEGFVGEKEFAQPPVGLGDRRIPPARDRRTHRTRARAGRPFPPTSRARTRSSRTRASRP